MKKRHILLYIIIGVLIAIVISGLAAFQLINKNLKELAELPISDVDMTKIQDGTYSGSYKVFPIAVTVKVIVEDHQIKDIELIKHDNGQGAPAAVIPDKVVEAQTLQVDTITSATYSSKVILKAIENALISAGG